MTLVDCAFYLEFYLIGYICNQRKQLWLVTDASKAKYLPNKKPLFSVSVSNNSTVLVLIGAVFLFQWEENMAGCGSASQRIRKWCHVRGIAHAYVWKRTAVLPLAQICFICPVRSKGRQPASRKLSVRFFIEVSMRC